MSAKENNPKVTVLINCFNGEATVERCLSSVLNQSYFNLEILFWDNQSTDKTAEIVQSFDDNRIRYFYAPRHTTLYEARNDALVHATGDFVAILDIDDWWKLNKVERQIELFADPEVGLVYSNFIEVNVRACTSRLKYSTCLPEGQMTDRLLKQYCVGSLTIMFRRSLVTKHRISFRPEYNHIGDFDFVLRLAGKTVTRVIQEPLAFCSWGRGNLSIVARAAYVAELSAWEKRRDTVLSGINPKTIARFKRHVKYVEWKYLVANRIVPSFLLTFLAIWSIVDRLPRVAADRKNRLGLWFNGFLARIIYRVARQYEFLYFRADPTKVRSFNDKSGKLEVCRMSAETDGIDAVTQFAEVYEVSELFDERYRQNAVIFYARETNGRIVHYSVLYPNAALSPLWRSPLPKNLIQENDAYLSTAETMPWARGGMIALFTLNSIVGYCNIKHHSIVNLIHPSTTGAATYYKSLGFVTIFSAKHSSRFRKIWLSGFRIVDRLLTQNTRQAKIKDSK